MENQVKIKQGPFEPAVESLQKFSCPDWFRDAKFGIWSHWGPQSVPMYGDWFYNVRDVYKSAGDVADTLMDIVSKNGNLLMNVTQKPDGTIDDETRFTLKKIGRWLTQNGEGIYGTRPYIKHKEGKTELSGGSFQESRAQWQSSDFRFTQKEGAVYAFMMRTDKSEQAVILTLGKNTADEITSVHISGRQTEFVQKDGALIARIPSGLDNTMPVCIKATLASGN